MASTQTIAEVQPMLEDPLAHLPRSGIVQHKKGQLIYNQDEPSTSIYLVIDGRVKVARLANNGRQTIVDIYQADDFFGESAFLGLPRMPEQAVALENTKVMAWTAAEMGAIAQTRPRLAIALLQIVVLRSLEYGQRIESFAMEDIRCRLARTLIRLSRKLGSPEADGSYRMPPLTHELLSQYVGTSREIITHFMNVFRKQGYVRYSRLGIILFPDAFNEWLCGAGSHAVETMQPPSAAGRPSIAEQILKRA